MVQTDLTDAIINEPANTSPVMLQWIPIMEHDAGGTPLDRRETFYWIAEMSAPVATRDDILGDSRVPTWLSRTHPTDPNMFVIDYSINQIAEVPQAYKVGIIYSNTYSNEDGQKGQAFALTPVENPLQRDAVITWGTYRTRKVFDTDLDDRPFATTAGEPIIHEEEIGLRVISVKKNVSGISTIFAKKGDFINKDVVKIMGVTFEVDTLWLTDVNLGTQTRENGFIFYELNFNLFYNPETWLVEKRNAGWCAFVPTQVRLANNPQNPRFTQFETALRYGRIKVGSPEHYPSTVLPIRNTPDDKKTNGTLFPEFTPIDPVTKVPKVVDSTDVNISPDRMKEIWKEAKLKFRTKERIVFQGSIPLK